MKSTGFIQLVGKSHQAGKIHNLHQVCGVFGCWENFKNTKNLKFEIAQQIVHSCKISSRARGAVNFIKGLDTWYLYWHARAELRHFVTIRMRSINCSQNLRMAFGPIAVLT